MNEIEKYGIATLAVIVLLLLFAMLAKQIPEMIERALPL